MRKSSINAEIVKDYIRKFPNTANLTLAKKIYSENKQLFNSVEHTRTILRSYVGANGVKNRNEFAVDFRKELAKLKKDLPKGETERLEPVILPSKIKRVLILSDIHFPFQDDEALFKAIEYGIEKQVDCIYLNGDIMDCYQLSRHEKDPRKRSMKYELDVCRAFLKGLRDIFPNALIYYKVGNHEERFDKYIRQFAPALLDIEFTTLEEQLHLREYGISYIHSKQWAYLGKLAILHGHELPVRSGGVNPARTARLKLNRAAIIGHFHKETKDTGKALNDSAYICHSIGCLCDLYPNYLPINEWGHGFAYVEVEKNGNYKVYPKTIIDGQLY